MNITIKECFLYELISYSSYEDCGRVHTLDGVMVQSGGHLGLETVWIVVGAFN